MKQSLIAILVGSEKTVTIIQTQTMEPGMIYEISERGIKNSLTSRIGNIHTNQISCSHYAENLSEIKTKVNRLIY